MIRAFQVSFALLVFAFSALGEGGVTSFGQIITNSASAATPVRLAPSNTIARGSIYVIGNKSARTTNTGTVYIGPISTNNTQPIAISPGQRITLILPPKEMIDLAEWSLDVTTANDGVVLIFSPYTTRYSPPAPTVGIIGELLHGVNLDYPRHPADDWQGADSATGTGDPSSNPAEWIDLGAAGDSDGSFADWAAAIISGHYGAVRYQTGGIWSPWGKAFSP